MIRYSKLSDTDAIERLLYRCFGRMVIDEGALKNIENGRYLCYIANGEIVAITGLCHDDEFNGIQISWTCTAPEHRHQGYMQALFKRLLATTDEDVYCSCWFIGDKPCNLHHIMDAFGFEKVVSKYKIREIEHNCPKAYREGCPYKSEKCICGNDLYVRKTK